MRHRVERSFGTALFVTSTVGAGAFGSKRQPSVIPPGRNPRSGQTSPLICMVGSHILEHVRPKTATREGASRYRRAAVVNTASCEKINDQVGE